MTADDLVVIGRLAMLLLTVLGVWLHFRGSRRERSGFDFDRYLLLLALYATWAYTSFGQLHGPPHGWLHTGELYHYHLGSKYAPELGFDGLYAATLIADDESEERCLRGVDRVRDLRTAQPTAAAPVRLDASIRARFSVERWRSFGADLAAFTAICDLDLWRYALNDHGYNAPPSRTVVTGAIATALGGADRSTLHLIAFLDPLLLLFMLGVVYRSYDLRTACLVAILLGAHTFAGYEWIGGSFLRHDWLCLTVLGICAIQSERHALAGVLIAAAALFRVFPAFFAAGFVLHGALAFARTRHWPSSLTRFLAGAAAASALLIGSSLLWLGSGAWLDFLSKITLHLDATYANNVALRTVFAPGGILLPLAQAGLGLAALASLWRVGPAQAVILGSVAIFAFGNLAGYYSIWLLVHLLWRRREATDFGSALFDTLVFCVPIIGALFLLLSPEAVPYHDGRVSLAASVALAIVCTALLARAAALGPWSAGVQSD